MLHPLTIATEDELSEAVAERLVGATRRFEVVQRLRRGGFGYLRRILPGLNRAAPGHAYLVLTDLDQANCPPQLLTDWLGPVPRHPNLLFRVAVREVESWLLADPALVTDLLGLSAHRVPGNPDTLLDPKRFLIDLARRARSAIRRDLVPRPGSSAQQGPGYNIPLVAFVRRHWNMETARRRSRSLDRTVARLNTWNPHAP
jgi:hypothetical protein